MWTPLVSEPGDWGPVPRATKARMSDLYTSSFQGDTSDLVLLLEQAGGRRQGRCLPASLPSGEDGGGHH